MLVYEKTQNNMAIGKHIFKRAKTGSPDIKQHPPPPLETKSANGEISFLDRKKIRPQIRQFHDITYDYSDKFYSYPS